MGKIFKRGKKGLGLLNFFFKYGRLKRIPRTGWLLQGVSLGDVESVADHTSRTSMISMILAKLLDAKGITVNRLKVVEMALLHDLSEALILDIDQRTAKLLGEDLKGKAEKSAELVLLKELPEYLKDPYLKLLQEFHTGKTLEARIVKTADKIEMICQSIEYSWKYSQKILKDFFNAISSLDDFSIEEMHKIIQELDDMIGQQKAT
jgi:putative hydrolase of HD superfamily